MSKIGMMTIGQSPREDIVSVMRSHFTHEVDILQRGALDALDLSSVAELRPQEGQSTLVTRMRDGTEVKVTHEKILPLMQKGIDALIEEGVELVVLLCTGGFPELKAERMVLHPGKLLHGVITALADGAKLGVVMPSASQVPLAEERREERWGGWDVVFTSASPYAELEIRVREWERAANGLKDKGVDLVYLGCMGMDEEMKKIVQRVTRKPVILASSVVARIVDELIGSGVQAR
jgi:protein AroM